jgi:hypothetical protein
MIFKVVLFKLIKQKEITININRQVLKDVNNEKNIEKLVN